MSNLPSNQGTCPHCPTDDQPIYFEHDCPAERARRVKAQHEETGRMWEGPRDQIPKGYSEALSSKTVLTAIDAEPELPGDLPSEMWQKIQAMVLAGDSEGIAELLRIVVRETKNGIRARVSAIDLRSAVEPTSAHAMPWVRQLLREAMHVVIDCESAHRQTEARGRYLRALGERLEDAAGETPAEPPSELDAEDDQALGALEEYMQTSGTAGNWSRQVWELINRLRASQSSSAPKEWRCFHCDELCTDEESAREHFGIDRHCDPICKVDRAEYRRMEQRNIEHTLEDTELHRALEAKTSEMIRAVRKAEEEGYNKGLADGRAMAGGLTSPSLQVAKSDVCERSDAARDVLAERERQKNVEGWTPEHDDEHHDEQLALAAACYALGSPTFWPWENRWWKLKDRRSNLVRAGALILAEIERIDRQSETKPAALGICPSCHRVITPSQHTCSVETKGGHIYSPRPGTEVCSICGFREREHAPEHMPVNETSGAQR